MQSRRFLFAVAVFLLAVTLGLTAQNEIAVLGLANYASPSVGEFTSGWCTGCRESEALRNSAGLGVEYRRWWGKNGASLSYSVGPADSTINGQAGWVHWPVVRSELALAWVRQFRWESRSPLYLKVGGGSFLLHGTLTGFDRQPEILAEAGTDTRVWSHLLLRSGFSVHLFRATGFGDPTYSGARTYMLEPKVGLVWTFGNRLTTTAPRKQSSSAPR